MDPAEGMMAVVRALPHAGLAMSLMDGNKQYTLMPKSNVASVQTGRPVPAATCVPVAACVVPVQNVGTDTCPDKMNAVHNHGTQAVDGRYASVYQMAHCNVHPTSPPVLLTEFPPQRAELSKGQGNFQVGGIGSGETTTGPPKLTQSFRGGMNWPDRTVYTPHQSCHYEPDSFADSLRKYPADISPERSAEIVERLINYTQMRTTCSKQSGKCSMSPTRSEVCPGQGPIDRRSYVATSLRTSRVYEPEVCIRSKVLDESPTRDTCKNAGYEALEFKRSLYGSNCDVRYLRDVTRRAKESVRNISTYPYNHAMCPPIRERYDHLPPKNSLLEEIISINSVHMETQAEIPMVSREVTTLPRVRPSMRNVAVPLSPMSSQSDFCKLFELEERVQNQTQAKVSNKSIQTTKLVDSATKPRRSVQTCISSIDITRKDKIKTSRKSKSQEEIRINDDLEEELLEVIKNLSLYSDLNMNFCVRNALMRKLLRIYRTERSDRVKVKLGRCVKDQFYSNKDSKNFTKELSDELISKIQARNIFRRCHDSNNIQRTDAASTRNNSDTCIDEIIKEWLKHIPVKSVDYLERPVTKDLVLQTVATRIKCLIMNKVHHDRCGFLKPDILDILEDLPIDIHPRNKNGFLNKIASDLVRKIQDVFSIYVTDRKRWQNTLKCDRTSRNNKNVRKNMYAYAYILPTDNELKQFVKEELKEFTTKFHVQICPSTEKDILIELIDLLADSLDAIRYGEDEKVRQELLILLSEFINISKNEGIYFVNNLVYNFKDLLKEVHTENIGPREFVILQDTVETRNKKTADDLRSIERNTNQNFLSNLSKYTQRLVEQIIEWMEDIQELSEVSLEFKKVAAYDLAEDIVDRQTYLELNPGNNSSDNDELEVLKYQIFKWVSKLVTDKNLETTEHAYRLMQKIQNIPVAMATKPAVTVMNIDTRATSCCKKDVGSLVSEQSTSDCPCKMTLQNSETNNDQRKRSCICTISYEIIRNKRNQCCAAEVDTKNLGVMTDLDKMKTDSSCSPVDPPPTKNVHTETDITQIPTTCSKGTCSIAEYLRAEQFIDRTISLPPRISANIQPAEPLVLVSTCNIQQQNTSEPQSPHRPLCCVVDNKDLNPTSTIKDLNDEYDQYLQNWISQIPINTSKPEELALIDTMKKGIYNGVWKARTKLQMNPNAMENPYYYQDLLDDELEELLDLLPKSCELTRNKQILKNQLIEKTINVNEQINAASAQPSYKQQLVDNINYHIPRKTVGFTDSDIAKTCEDVHKLNIAEMFIMFTMYRDKDTVKANVYKKKLMKYIQEFFENLKKTHGTEVKDVDYKLYKDEILNALFSVSQPSEETMMEEGDEVLVGLEIEQWFSDLPLYPTDSNFETLCRKRYRDTLAKKVHDMEKQNNLANCEEELRHEITRFMGKLPIREESIQNMPFMVEELVNRLKNRPNDLVLGSEKRRLMPLTDPYDYDEFSRHMPLCSSFSDDPDARKPQINQSSFIIRGGERVTDEANQLAGEYGYVHFRGDTPNSTQDWVSMHADEDFPPMPDSNQQDSQARQACPGPNCNQDQAPRKSVQNSPDCCQLQNGTARNQTVPQNNSYRHPQSIRREGTSSQGEEQAPYTSQLQHTRFSGSCAQQTAPSERRSSRRPSDSVPYVSLLQDTPMPRATSPRPSMTPLEAPSYTSRLQETQKPGPCSRPTSPDQRQMRLREPSPYTSRQQDSQMPGPNARLSFAEQRPAMMPQEPSPYTPRLQDSQMPGPNARLSFAEQRPPTMPQEPSPYTSRLQDTEMPGPCARRSSPGQRQMMSKEPTPHTSRLQETRFSGTCARPSTPAQKSPERSLEEYSSPGRFPRNICPRDKSRRRAVDHPEPADPTYGQEVSTRPCDGLRPGTSQEQFSSRQSPSGFSGQPVCNSTPQQSVPPPHVSRPKKRTTKVNRSKRDAVRKRLEVTDSDESDSEEMCRCMERFLKKYRKRRPICEDCDMDYPPCFPLRFAYPYYF